MYKYKEQRPYIFTDIGQRDFLKVRDNVQRLLDEAGSFKLLHALKNIYGDSWLQIAYVDRLVELGEIREITGKDVPGQCRVFVRA